jgi:hypothetical protein
MLNSSDTTANNSSFRRAVASVLSTGGITQTARLDRDDESAASGADTRVSSRPAVELATRDGQEQLEDQKATNRLHAHQHREIHISKLPPLNSVAKGKTGAFSRKLSVVGHAEQADNRSIGRRQRSRHHGRKSGVDSLTKAVTATARSRSKGGTRRRNAKTHVAINKTRKIVTVERQYRNKSIPAESSASSTSTGNARRTASKEKEEAVGAKILKLFPKWLR